MNYSKYHNYCFLYTPSKFIQDHLIVADGMSYLSAEDFFYDRTTFNNNLVLMVVKGTLYVEQYNQKYTLRSGQGIMMKLTDHHKYYTDPVDIAHIIWFHFRGNMVTPILNTLQHYEYLPVLFQDDPCIKDSIYRCFEITEQHSDTFEYELSAHIYQTILHIANPYLERIRVSDSTENSWFTDAVHRYVNDHIYEKITLEQLSDHLNMNKYYFARKFRQVFNTSAMQYVLSVKLQFAQKLLNDPEQSISSISHSLGFSDQAHFSRTFRKHFGISPTSYQKCCKQKHI